MHRPEIDQWVRCRVLLPAADRKESVMVAVYISICRVIFFDLPQKREEMSGSGAKDGELMHPHYLNSRFCEVESVVVSPPEARSGTDPLRRQFRFLTDRTHHISRPNLARFSHFCSLGRTSFRRSSPISCRPFSSLCLKAPCILNEYMNPVGCVGTVPKYRHPVSDPIYYDHQNSGT
jgi:hypothetical protein